jgi:hypothetical protein
MKPAPDEARYARGSIRVTAPIGPRQHESDRPDKPAAALR